MLKRHVIPQQNEFAFQVADTQIVFSSKFDSGNCGNVTQVSDTEYDIEPYPDFDATNNKEGWAKSWFYFKVQGFTQSSIKFNVKKLKMLYQLWITDSASSYRPVFRIGDEGSFVRLKTPVTLQDGDKEGQFKMSFNFNFAEISHDASSKNAEVYFSFSYPYSYSQNLQFIESLNVGNSHNIYLHKEIITYTPQMRLVHLLTISSTDFILPTSESYLSDAMFPERDYHPRAQKFAAQKPVVLISARVHPGETPSSFALEGLIKFLLHPTDLRSLLLRKFFTFMIVPMLNPDGVYCGHYRMDIFNQNLNRFYQAPMNSKQPSIYAMNKLITHLSSHNRLFFYMDFHSHARNKPAFLYGNAIDSFHLQAENMLFAKLLSLNDPTFDYTTCIFSKPQVKPKDKPDENYKEGCGRVFSYEQSKLVHCYTLECGFHHANWSSSTDSTRKPNAATSVVSTTHNNSEFTLIYDGNTYSLSDTLKPPQRITSSQAPVFFTPETYENTGKAVLISLLDVYSKNPYSLISNIDQLRLETALELARLDKLTTAVYKKAKDILNILNSTLFAEIERKNIFQFEESTPNNRGDSNSQLQTVPAWPENFANDFIKKHTGWRIAEEKRLKKLQLMSLKATSIYFSPLRRKRRSKKSSAEEDEMASTAGTTITTFGESPTRPASKNSSIPNIIAEVQSPSESVSPQPRQQAIPATVFPALNSLNCVTKSPSPKPYQQHLQLFTSTKCITESTRKLSESPKKHTKRFTDHELPQLSPISMQATTARRGFIQLQIFKINPQAGSKQPLAATSAGGAPPPTTSTTTTIAATQSMSSQPFLDQPIPNYLRGVSENTLPPDESYSPTPMLASSSQLPQFIDQAIFESEMQSQKWKQQQTSFHQQYASSSTSDRPRDILQCSMTTPNKLPEPRYRASLSMSQKQPRQMRSLHSNDQALQLPPQQQPQQLSPLKFHRQRGCSFGSSLVSSDQFDYIPISIIKKQLDQPILCQEQDNSTLIQKSNKTRKHFSRAARDHAKRQQMTENVSSKEAQRTSSKVTLVEEDNLAIGNSTLQHQVIPKVMSSSFVNLPV